MILRSLSDSKAVLVAFIRCQVETRHLIAEADENQDGVLTKAEIVEKHDLFVGSQATDFGDILLRHDEF